MDNLIPDYGPPEIDPEEIEIYEDCLLGSGAFGNVYYGCCRSQDVAVKILINQELSEEELDIFRKEINLMSSINHPNIVLYMGACTIPGNLKIVTERMESDLSTVLHNPDIKLTLLQKIKMAKDCALGMSWLHGSNNPIIHHDLKPSNCLIDKNFRIKISDFGLSIMKPKGSFVHSDFPKGTAVYMAPEVYQGEDYDEKCDVYSFGIILWEIYTREEPYKDSRQNLSVETFCDAVSNENLRPEISEDCPINIKTLILDCWEEDPDARPSFSTIVDRLNNIIIEEAILDTTGRNFWKRNLNNKEKIPWSQFIREFSKFIGFERYETDKELLSLVQCMEVLFATEESGQHFVTLEHFGKMLDFFGPIRREGSKNLFLPNLKNIISQNWFHGEISTQEADARLYYKNPGTFLIRFSSSERGYFTISQREVDNQSGGLRHVRIKHPPLKDEYSVKYTIYSSLIELIEKETTTLNLKEPCIGSSFSFLLTRGISDNGYI
jgi:serine/threonine protein kinase